MTQAIKLQAADADDLQVISAVLQDAIAPVVDMHYFAAEKNFVMVVQRLCRDNDVRKERVCCAINMRGVEKVETQGFSPADADGMLDLLAFMPEGDELQMIFAGEARIRLHLKDWHMIVEDFGEPWPAKCDPCHENEAGG